MKKLAIVILAATALVPPASAQTAAPAARAAAPARMTAPARMAPAPGVTWRQRGPMATPRVLTRPTAPRGQPHAGRPHRPGAGSGHGFHRGGDNRVVGRGPHRGPRFRHIRRFQHGFILPHFWFGPQFHVSNWGLYGFSQPYGDQRWIRHYDDAYLIGGDGRIHDSRYGMDWDSYGERWNYGEGGGPPMYGDESPYPPEGDYGYGGGHGQGGYPDGGHGGHGGGGHAGGGPGAAGGYGPPPGTGPGHGGGACQMTYSDGGPPPPPPPCAHGAGWGYGWGTMVVTETTTTTTTGGPRVTKHSYHVEEAPAPSKRMYRPAPSKRKYRPAPPPPSPGERG
jgi:Ni/Co efflux regulator RcnB